MPGAKSCIAGYFYLVTDPNPLNYNKAPTMRPSWLNVGPSRIVSAQQQRLSVVDFFTTHRMQS
eukprot:2697450-Ditylum_brightwellii.AAC.1